MALNTPSVLAEALGIHPNTALRYAAVADTNYLPCAAKADGDG